LEHHEHFPYFTEIVGVGSARARASFGLRVAFSRASTSLSLEDCPCIQHKPSRDCSESRFWKVDRRQQKRNRQTIQRFEQGDQTDWDEPKREDKFGVIAGFS
jgi:hypothetical protein